MEIKIMSDEKKLKVEAGNHVVKVDSWGLRETKAGNIQVWIRFSNGATMFQNVNANETGDEILARSLVLCGFEGKDLADLYKKNALDTKRNVKIYVQHKPNEDGEMQMQVNVSDPARGGMKGDLEKAEGLNLIKKLKLSLKPDLKAALSDDILTDAKVEDDDSNSAGSSNNDEDEDDDSEDIPF